MTPVFFGLHSKHVWPGWRPLCVWKCEECPARVSTIDLGTFGVVQVKLWSKNVEKSWNIQFYCCSLIIYRIWIPWKCVEFPARVDKIELGSFWVLAVKLWSENVQKTPKMQFYRSSRIIYEIWIHSKNEELAPRVDKIGLGWFGVIPMKLWSENVEKTQKTNFPVVLLLFMIFWIFGKNREKISRGYKSGLGWFGVISVKLWSENVEKSRKDNFTVVLLLFMKIWIFGKFGENFIRVDKIGLGWFGVVPEKLWSIYWKNHTFTAKCLCSRIIYDSGSGF